MNPFDLAGPPFLLFFIGLGWVVIDAMRAFNRSREQACHHSPLVLDDPYSLAFLRGGEAEAKRVATIALVDRGLLKAAGHQLIVSSPQAEKFVQRPIERGILVAFQRSASAAFRKACPSPGRQVS